MRRASIRLQIAKAISETLPVGHVLSYVNVRRYVTRDRLTEYNIRRDVPIHSRDWTVAIQVAREERVIRNREMNELRQPPVLYPTSNKTSWRHRKRYS